MVPHSRQWWLLNWKASGAKTFETRRTKGASRIFLSATGSERGINRQSWHEVQEYGGICAHVPTLRIRPVDLCKICSSDQSSTVILAPYRLSAASLRPIRPWSATVMLKTRPDVGALFPFLCKTMYFRVLLFLVWSSRVSRTGEGRINCTSPL